MQTITHRINGIREGSSKKIYIDTFPRQNAFKNQMNVQYNLMTPCAKRVNCLYFQHFCLF